MNSKDIQFYNPREVFKINPNATVSLARVGGEVDCLVIDDFYLNPDMVRDLAISTPSTFFISRSGGKGSELAYHDMRTITEPGPLQEVSYTVNNASSKYLGIKSDEVVKTFMVNVFKNIATQPPNSQAVPHNDGNSVVGMVYLNKGKDEHEGESGTAVYRSKHTGRITIKNQAEHDKLFAGVDYGDEYYSTTWEDDWELADVIPNKYNRCAVYPGEMVHGAYHLPYQYNEAYRLTQVLFHDNKYNI